MVNTGAFVVAHVQTPDRKVCYEGGAQIDGVPGTAAPVMLDFQDVAGASCGSLLPTGAATTVIDGIDTCCIDNGMPVVVIAAASLGKTGYETPAELEADASLKQRIESIRLQAGRVMNLGDVAHKTVPKMCLVAAAQYGGAIATRTFIPHRVHETIGVLGAVSVATACLLPGSVAQKISRLSTDGGSRKLEVEHPGGHFTVEMEFTTDGDTICVQRAALLRTARKIMQGEVFVPRGVWAGQ
jgi:4-oxalomesaconate tautomerase